MNVTQKHAEKLGFTGMGMYANARTYNHYYKCNLKFYTITCISNLFPQTVSVFYLSPIQYELFMEGDLKLVPPHCCSPTTGRAISKCKVLFEGEIKNLRHLRGILDGSAPMQIVPKKTIEVTIEKPFSGIRDIPQSCSFSNIETGDECENVTNLFTLLEYGFGIRNLSDKQEVNYYNNMNPNDGPKFNPVESQGKLWNYGSLPYREICRNNAQPAPTVCIVSATAWERKDIRHMTTLDVPLALLREP